MTVPELSPKASTRVLRGVTALVALAFAFSIYASLRSGVALDQAKQAAATAQVTADDANANALNTCQRTRRFYKKNYREHQLLAKLARIYGAPDTYTAADLRDYLKTIPNAGDCKAQANSTGKSSTGGTAAPKATTTSAPRPSTEQAKTPAKSPDPDDTKTPTPAPTGGDAPAPAPATPDPTPTQGSEAFLTADETGVHVCTQLLKLNC